MRVHHLPFAALLLASAACDGSGGSPTTPPTERPLSSYQLAVLRPQGAFRADLFLMNADGSGAVALTSTPETEYHPSWSPDGKKLVFVRATDTLPPAGRYDLWTIGADGSGATQLTFLSEHPGERVFEPAWSPDGSRIAYTLEERLYLMDADGRNRRPVGLKREDGPVDWLAWSPDGSRLAVERRRPILNVGSEVATVGADGSGLKGLSSVEVSDSWPAWSPDGTKIAFVTYSRSDDRYVLAMMNADGTGRKLLTSPPSRHQIVPSWSPDGRWIAYVSYQDGGSGEGRIMRAADGVDVGSLGPVRIGPIAWRP